MVKGTVVRFNEDKGYGFIAQDGGAGDDVFVHARELPESGAGVRTGTRVEFEIIDGERGLKAYNVRVLRESPLKPGAAVIVDAVETVKDPLTVGPLNGSPSTEEGLVEVLPQGEFRQEITDLLLKCAPGLTGTQITELRTHLLDFAREKGWVNLGIPAQRTG